MNDISTLIRKEGWEIITKNGKHSVIAKDKEFPLIHPAAIHLKFYRDETNPEIKYMHMKAAHDYLWPDDIKTWNYWTERRFKAHCEAWNFISYAGGANIGKSYDAAKIVLLWWWANPRKRGVVVASTTLESVSARIWGYVTKLISKSKVKFPFQYLGGQSPKILYPAKRSGNEIRDTIHGMFAIAAKKGNDESAISSWIGRHPDDGLMMILDEATDIPVSLVKALPNLESGGNPFQCVAIGNSLSVFDLHGSLSTPLEGWDKIVPKKDSKGDIIPIIPSEWRTTQKNGICLFFNAYDSPAIHETDPEKKKLLGKIFITEEKLKEKEETLGKTSDLFWRFVIGFWRSESTDSTVISRKFIEDYRIFRPAEWSGLHPLSICCGLDPAFSTGGDDCILRLAILGQTIDGSIVLDFRRDELKFKLQIRVDSNDSAEMQIAKQTIAILDRFGGRLPHLCVDANGQGRALGEVIKLQAQELVPPTKIYSTKGGNVPKNSFDVTVRTAHEMWFAFRNFIQHEQIRGLDDEAIQQLTTRLEKIEGQKKVLESKKEYKTRMSAINPAWAHSPDSADAAALCLQSAMIHFGFAPGQKRAIVNPVRKFAHDKFYQAGVNMKAQKEAEKESYGPEANFLGNAGDTKIPYT